MGSTFLSLHYHVVFSTKHRKRFIHDEWGKRLHHYLGGTVNGLEGRSLCVGGVADHVHLLLGLKSTHRLADLMRELKKSSSIWVHEEVGMDAFAWQEGYAAFTVSPTAISGVSEYIKNQEEHHRHHSSREELISMLQHAGIEFKPEWLD